MVYSFDTSAIIEPWRRTHPPDVFVRLWEGLESLIDSGEIVCTDEVLEELGRKDDEISKWAKERPYMFLPIDDAVQAAVTTILSTAHFENLVKPGSQRNQADPFVVALAQVKNLTVVTYERAPGSVAKPRIPDVCNHFGVPCISFVEVIRRQGWTF